MCRIKWTDDKGEAREANTKGIKKGKGKQQRAKLAKKNGVKTAMERVQRQTRGGD